MEIAKQTLKKYWGYDSFRENQEEIINNIILGKNSLIILSTGGGKSICFQLPALISDGLTIVISPLIALMEDQVRNLNNKGIDAMYLNSSLLPQESKKVLISIAENKYKIIYTSPEKFQSKKFLEIIKKIKISRIVFDEVHCLSEWGHDFRPDYKRIGKQIRELNLCNQIVAFTATATSRVRKEIIEILDLKDVFISISSFDRKNIFIGIKKFITPLGKYLFFKKVLSQSSKTLIYCSTRSITEFMSAKLSRKLKIKTGFYHAGCAGIERKNTQEDFKVGNISCLLATTAFGMGIDISDIDTVIYWNFPSSIEEYYQGIGRAGRNEEVQAKSWMLYNSSDIKLQNNLLSINLPTNNILKKVIRSILSLEKEKKIREKFNLSETIINAITLILESKDTFKETEVDKNFIKVISQDLKKIFDNKKEKFKSLRKLASNKGCKRKYLLEYFGEIINQENCNNCSYCLKS
ncbi:MAG: ATP-dependent DNA helicase RecQ [Candidatus Sericytochromatia bacterium]|nr:ATP-dependent DNA helicase RecQ [Candidatus Sericytochromatia bacterium]